MADEIARRQRLVARDRKGAALNAVQIAEVLVNRRLLTARKRAA